MNFIYAFNEDDRKDLLDKGFKEIFYCYINNKKAYAFENIPTKFYAMYSETDRNRFLITNMAYFI